MDMTRSPAPDEPSSIVHLPPRVAAQLEKMNEVMMLQKGQLSLLRNQNDLLAVENADLRSKVDKMSNQMSGKLMEQHSFLSSLQQDMTLLRREKNTMEEQLFELERKYKKAKAASREFARVLEYENDLFGSHRGDNTATADDSTDNLLERSRSHYQKLQEADGEEQRLLLQQSKTAAPAFDYESDRLAVVTAYADAQQELNQLSSLLKEERNCSRSLGDDLDETRKMVFDRDEKIAELTSELADTKMKLNQMSEQLKLTQTDLQMERAQADDNALAFQEQERVFAQIVNGAGVTDEENQMLAARLKEANVTILSLKTKLDVQGADLLNTKRQLRAVIEQQCDTRNGL